MLLAAFGSPGFKRPPVTFLRRCVKLFVVPVMAVILHDTSPFTSVETLQRRIGGVSAAPPLSRQRSCYLSVYVTDKPPRLVHMLRVKHTTWKL